MADETRGALVIWHDIAAQHEDLVNDWYNREHHLERLSIPGFTRVQRFIAISGTPKYFIFYEVGDVSVLNSPAYMDRQNTPTAWTQKAMPQFRNNSRTVCETVWQRGFGVGGIATTFRVAPAKGGETKLREWMTGNALPEVMAQQGIVSCKYWEADRERTAIPSTVLGLRGAPDTVVDRIVLVSGNTRETVGNACAKFLSSPDFVANGASSEPSIGVYRLIFAASA